MTAAQLNEHVRQVKQRLSMYPSGPVHKFLSKHLEVIEKVQELHHGQESEGDV